MEEIIYTGTVFARKGSNSIGFLTALAIMGFLWGGLGFVLGEKGPEGFYSSAPFALLIGFVALISANHLKKKLALELQIILFDETKIHIVIRSQSSDELVSFQSPFGYKVGWDEMNLGKGKRQKLLYVIFQDISGKRLLVLEQFLGVLDPLPDNWPKLSAEERAGLVPLYRNDDVKKIGEYFIYR